MQEVEQYKMHVGMEYRKLMLYNPSLPRLEGTKIFLGDFCSRLCNFLIGRASMRSLSSRSSTSLSIFHVPACNALA